MGPTTQRLITYLGAFLISVTLLGLLLRRRIRVSYLFTAYLIAVLMSQFLIATWPARFHVWWFYRFKETAHDVLKFGIATELMFLLFAAFPAAAVTIRRVLLIVLVAILVVVLRTEIQDLQHSTIVVTLQPLILNGTAIIFTAVFGLVLWYRIPLHPVHKAILFAFIPYLLVFTTFTDLLRRSNLQVPVFLTYTNSFAYATVLLYWAVVALRPRRPPPGDPVTIQRIQPWLLARTGGMW